MSLNKLTNAVDYLDKQYLNVGCNQIRCTSLFIKGTTTQASYLGTYTPTISISDGSRVTDQYAIYTYVGSNLGAVLDINVYCKMTVATSTSLYNFKINLPDSLKCFSTKAIPSIGSIHNRGGAVSFYSAIQGTTTQGSNNFIVSFNETTAIQLPVGVGENFVNFNVKIEVNA